ncbi:uncharacterized protein [Hoplias malabaricus]|uniref:uncharacterized protein n=1 Tax=Hoplias malabaricus TaxID=27720 RepID=UPI00346315D3
MDQQSVSVKDPKSSGQTDSNHHTFKKCHKLKSSCSSNVNPSSLDSTRQKSMGLSVVEGDGPKPLREVIFTTEVPQKAILEKGNSDKWENKSDMFGKDLSGETHIFSSKNTQKILQDQIQRVVVNLEEVLQDLKEVHMEMKEVVQQIDQLTSSIDLGEEVAKEDSRGVPEEVSVHKKIRKHQFMDTSECANSPSENPSTLPRNNKRFQASGTDQLMAKHTTHLTPPAYPTGTNCLVLKHNHGASENKGAKSEATKGSRRKKPPPYPFSSRAGTGNKEKDTGLNTLPYSGRRKVLSTTV